MKKTIILSIVIAMMMSFCTIVSAETSITVEGEEYTTVSDSTEFKIASWITAASGGKHLQVWNQKTKTYSVTYEVEVEKAGTYALDLYATDPNKPTYASPYVFMVNGYEYEVALADGSHVSSDIRHLLGKVRLKAGINTIKFEFSTPRSADGSIVFMVDRFVLTRDELIKGGAIYGGDYIGENVNKPGVSCENGELNVSADAPEGEYVFDYNVITDKQSIYNIQIAGQGITERCFVSVNDDTAQKPVLNNDGSFSVQAVMTVGINKISFILDDTPTAFVLEKFKFTSAEDVITLNTDEFSGSGEMIILAWLSGNYQMTFSDMPADSTMYINDIEYQINEKMYVSNNDGGYNYITDVLLSSGENIIRIGGDCTLGNRLTFVYKNCSPSVLHEVETQPGDDTVITSAASGGEYLKCLSDTPIEFTQYFAAPSDGIYSLTMPVPILSNTPSWFSPINVSVNGSEFVEIMTGNVVSLGTYWFDGTKTNEKVRLRKTFKLNKGVNGITFKCDILTSKSAKYNTDLDYCLFEPQSYTSSFTDIEFHSKKTVLFKDEETATETTVFNDGSAILFEGDIEYSSSNNNIAEVNAEGVITGKNHGVARITANVTSSSNTDSKYIDVYVIDSKMPVAILNAEKSGLGIKIDLVRLNDAELDDAEIIVAVFDEENGILTNIKNSYVYDIKLNSVGLLQTQYIDMDISENQTVKVFAWAKSPQRPVLYPVDVN